MSRNWAVRFGRTSFLFAAAASSIQCADSTAVPVAPGEFSAAKGGARSGVSVTAADPSYGYQGQLGERVKITGSGFEPGARAAWERGGVADPKIQVLSTEYVSSTELTATINIAADADLALYDISVTTASRGKGIGTEMFEVTTAISIGTLGGHTSARAINENGQATGHSMEDMSRAYFWDARTGEMVRLEGSVATGWAIDERGTTIGGIANSEAVLWTFEGGAWRLTALPHDANAVTSVVTSIGSDPVTGEAVLLGGGELLPIGSSEQRRPRLWRKGAAGWERVLLTAPTTRSSFSSRVEDVNGAGYAVGSVSGIKPTRGDAPQAVIWEPSASGWVGRVIGPQPSGAEGVNNAGTLVVGEANGVAAYWRRAADGSFTGPHQLVGACARAVDVDELDRIVATLCPHGSRETAAVFSPPSYGEPLYLSGFGDRSEAGMAAAISPRGTWISGSARSATRHIHIGAVWNFLTGPAP